MKRNARDYSGTTIVAWMVTENTEWLVDVSFSITAAEPQTWEEPVYLGGIEMHARRVYQEVDTPYFDRTSDTMLPLKKQVTIDGAAAVWNQLIDLDEDYREEVARECSEHAQGEYEAAMEARGEAQRESRMGL